MIIPTNFSNERFWYKHLGAKVKWVKVDAWLCCVWGETETLRIVLVSFVDLVPKGVNVTVCLTLEKSLFERKMKKKKNK